MKFKKAKLLNQQKTDKTKKRTAQRFLNEEQIRSVFSNCTDVQFSACQFNDLNVLLVYCTGLVSSKMLFHVIPQKLEEFSKRQLEDITLEKLFSLQLPSIQPVQAEEQLISDIFSGKLVLLFKKQEILISVDIAERPERKPEETATEVSVKGPRDNFIENIAINYALIRKRLRTTSLVSENFELGTRSKTKVSLLYMKDIADQNVLEQIKQKLSAVNVDSLLSGAQLEELINDEAYAIFPRHTYTGRADFAVESLLNGRFVILIDGVAYAYITPVNLFFLLKSAEDKENNYLFNSFERLMRVLGITIATFLPGFWVALTAFHQNQLPLNLLATVVESRRGVPFPTALEAFLMLLLFELFREAGLRLPIAVGQTLSVVGGLIIGDAAIRAGLTSPAMLVIIAASTVATYTLVNQTLVGTISLMRFFVIFLVSLFGFFGFFVSMFLIGILVARVRVFGVPYLEVATRLDWKNIAKAILRLPFSKYEKRMNALNPQDATKKGGS